MRVLVLAALVAVVFPALAHGELHLQIATADGAAVRCGSSPQACTASPDSNGVCRLAISFCTAGRRGVVRLETRGTPVAAMALEDGLEALPGASARPRSVAFAPPLAAGCHDLGVVTIGMPSAVRIVLRGRTSAGHRLHARVRAACDGPPVTEPPPPPPPPPDAAPALVFAREVIDPEGGGQPLSDIAPGDVDGDGRPDVVVSGFLHLLWYHGPDWTPHPIADGAFGRGGKTVVRDVDGDGRLDVITGAIDDTLPLFAGGLTMVWFRNTAAGWERHLLTDAAYCHDLVFGDLDADGRDDALCLDQQRGEVFRLAPPVEPTAEWTVQVIDPDENAMGSAIADIDRDGRPDVVVGRAWYRSELDGTWTRHQYTDIVDDAYPDFRDYAKVSVLDLDGDGRLDVFATLYAETPAGRVYAFLAPSDPATGAWTPVEIDPGPLFGVHSQAAASFDGSRRPQIMVGETGIGGFEFGLAPDPHIKIHRLLGAATDPMAWEHAVVDVIGTHEATAVDLDGDGLPDLIGHEENTQVVGRNGGVFAWRNRTVR